MIVANCSSQCLLANIKPPGPPLVIVGNLWFLGAGVRGLHWEKVFTKHTTIYIRIMLLISIDQLIKWPAIIRSRYKTYALLSVAQLAMQLLMRCNWRFSIRYLMITNSITNNVTITATAMGNDSHLTTKGHLIGGAIKKNWCRNCACRKCDVIGSWVGPWCTKSDRFWGKFIGSTKFKLAATITW